MRIRIGLDPRLNGRNFSNYVLQPDHTGRFALLRAERSTRERSRNGSMRKQSVAPLAS